MPRVLAITLALFAALYLCTLARYAPPAPAGSDAPRERFSATRARAAQELVVGDGATRYVGTKGNARARAAIASELERLGWEVETQHAASCTYHGKCAPVANVIAHFAGREPDAPAVLLSAHYDSALVSPGASDDGFGVATLLETARAIAVGPPPRRSVVLLFSDGEEAGLLGADAFVRAHRFGTRFLYTINVDARGSSGPSTLFETHPDNRALVGLMAAHLDRPVSTSLSYEVYKRMPNDTDFSITKRSGLGINFANIARIEHYHTPLDALGVADLGTLQHHGDHVLGMTRAFTDADPPDQHGGTVWFDVLALAIVRWPEKYATTIAVLAALAIVGHGLRRRTGLRGFFVFLASLTAGVVSAFVVGVLLRALGALPAPYLAFPRPALLALHAAAAAASLGVAFLLARRSTPEGLWPGTWFGWAVLGMVAAAFAPGTSYLFVVPAIAAGLAGFLPVRAAAVVPAASAALVVLALAVGLYDALGFVVPPVAALPTVLLCTTLAPMLAGLDPRFGRRVPAALGGLAIVAGVFALIVPKFTASHPQRANVVFRQDDEGARVYVDTTWGPKAWGTAPRPMVAALAPLGGQEPALPWTLPAAFAAAAPIAAKPPEASVLSVSDRGGKRRVEVRLRSPRGARDLILRLPLGRAISVTVDGRPASPRTDGGGSTLGLLAVPSDGIVVGLEASGPDPIALTLFDRSAGVPPGTKADDAVRLRPAEATPFQDGDVTVLATKLSL